MEQTCSAPTGDTPRDFVGEGGEFYVYMVVKYHQNVNTETFILEDFLYTYLPPYLFSILNCPHPQLASPPVSVAYLRI